jgi:predicted DNA-binding protein (UPF0251 family)/predicted Fe-Mo cluster-binding NifX family protein
MPRPKKCCAIRAVPNVTYYKPRGIPMHQLKEAALSLEGFEAVRLADYQGMSQHQAAEYMQVSRATFGRILAQARYTIAQAMAEGMALSIQGGNYAVNHWTGKADNQPAPPSNQNKEKPMTKLAISTEGPTLEDALDPRFGRAAGFIIFDTETSDHTYRENGLAQTMAQGAGIQAAETVVTAGVQAVLTGSVGPKAYKVLEAAGVKIAQDLENMTVQEAIDRFQKGEVQWASTPNSQGHGR